MPARGALRRVCAGLALVGLSAAVAHACEVPVFRYALERWAADPYEIVIFHQGSPTPGVGSIADALSAHGPANVQLRWIDATSPLPPPLRELRDATLRAGDMVLRHVRTGEAIWSGPVAADRAGELLQSPARNTIAERLLDGDSAVWVLLEVGDPQRDDDAAALLEDELETLEDSLQLPVDSLALDISFSLLRVSRTDPQEQVLVGALLGSELDLAATQKPMAFPVFGRGRVLYALVGPGISAANIAEACAFLIGPCACEIKADNPGFDLPMAVDWTANVEQLLSAIPLPSVASVGPVIADRVAQDTTLTATAGDGRLMHNTGLAFLIGTAAVVAAGLLLYRRQR